MCGLEDDDTVLHGLAAVRAAVPAGVQHCWDS